MEQDGTGARGGAAGPELVDADPELIFARLDGLFRLIPNIAAALLALFAGLSIGAVATGFLFKDSLQNMLAGILILIRQPSEAGDRLVAARIETHTTLIRPHDGPRVVVPNTEACTNAVTGKTAFEKRRSQSDLGIGCRDGRKDAIDILRDAASGPEGVLRDPASEALPWDLGQGANVIRLRAAARRERRRSDTVSNENAEPRAVAA